MIKRFTLLPFYPFFFVLFVILNLLVANLDEIDPALAVRPTVVLLLLVGGAILLFRASFKDWHYAGYLAFLIFFLVFTYGHLSNVLVNKLPEEYAEMYQYTQLAVPGVALTGLGLKRTWRWLGGARVTPFLNLVFAFTLISQAGFGLAALVRQLPVPGALPAGSSVIAITGQNPELDCSRSPDIYWIILDGYGRSDALEEIYKVDTSGFLTSLEEMGFYVADQSHSNYIQTVYSLSSALNYRYVAPKPANIPGYKYFPELIADNRLTALLEQCGYQTVAFDSGFRFTNYPDADVYLQYGADDNEFEAMLLANGPLEVVREKTQTRLPPRSYAAHRARVNFAFQKLAELPAKNGPQFVYAHIISPHPPFVFNAQGNPVQPRRGYSQVDGSDYRGSWTEYRRGYAGQVQHVNRLVEETVSAILARSATPPVIIIQGDHGPGGHLEWGSPDRTCLYERTPILLAYYLPDGGDRQLYPGISPVNSFRVVLNAYFGLDMDLLPDETYFTSEKAGGPFIDVTEQRDSKENCD